MHFGKHGIDPDTVLSDVGWAPGICIDRHQITLPVSLHAVTAEIEQRVHSGADPVGEAVDRIAHVGFPDIGLEIDLETATAQLVGQAASVGDRGGKGDPGAGVGCVADYQRNARRLLLRPCRGSQSDR